MTYYLMIYTFVLCCSLFAYEKNLAAINNRLTSFLFCGFLIMLAGFRYNISTDYWNYHRFFWSDVANSRFEFLFKHFMLFCKNAFWSYNAFVFLTALISISIKGMYFSRLRNPFFAVFIYICIYFFDSDFNGLRQGMGIGFAYFAIEMGRKRNFIPYCLFLLAAVMLHASYLVLFPFYFLCDKHFTISIKKILLLLVLLFAVRMTVLNQLLRYFQGILSGSGNLIVRQLAYYLGVGDFAINLAILRRLFFVVVYILLFGTDNMDIYFMLYFISFLICFMLSGAEMFAHRLSGVFDIFAVPLFAGRKMPFTAKNMLLVLALVAGLTALYFGGPMRASLPYQSYL